MGKFGDITMTFDIDCTQCNDLFYIFCAYGLKDRMVDDLGFDSDEDFENAFDSMNTHLIITYTPEYPIYKGDDILYEDNDILFNIELRIESHLNGYQKKTYDLCDHDCIRFILDLIIEAEVKGFEFVKFVQRNSIEKLGDEYFHC